jgi:serine/threonine-protein kinase
MPLEIGSRLGHYDVTALIGEGGMGQVYQATDTKLNRQVALKILPEAFAGDPDRLARFQREAQVLASLNHPNIAAIHGLEESEGTRALVLELVEGPTLADRIAQGPIPIDEALPIAKQIAEALEAAHEAGVIHRDLKPANIKVREDGTVKVLDFGLAKALDPVPSGDASQSPTLTAAATQMGVIMGTAAYMSPEQARGSVVDSRADVWSFGVVLYEMLTGTRLFDGATVSDTLASVLKTEPDWEVLSGDIPASIKKLLRRCLNKDRKDRLQHIGDARVEINEALTAPASDETVVAPVVQTTGWRHALPGSLIALIVGIVMTSLVMWSLRPESPPRAPARFVISASPSAVPNSPVDATGLAISPDGRLIAYRATVDGESGLYIRPVDGLEGRLLPGTEGALGMFFSPNGTEVGFATFPDPALKKIRVSGGPITTLAPMPSPFRGASWGTDGSIVFARANIGNLFRVSEAGGEPQILTTPEDTQRHRWPEVLLNGRGVLFTIAEGPGIPGTLQQLAVFDLETDASRPLGLLGSHPRYLSSGHLIYSSSGNTLWAVAFDADRLEVIGDPVRVLEQVFVGGPGGANVAVSTDGSLVYQVGGSQAAHRTLAWVNREGQEEPFVAMPPRPYDWPRLSPDGHRVVVDTGQDGGDLFLYNVETGLDEQFTTDPALDSSPIWSGDGSEVVFRSQREEGQDDLYSKAADGSGSVEPLTSNPVLQLPWDFADGRTLVLAEDDGQGTSWDIATLQIGEGTPPEKLLQTEYLDGYPAVSPNRRWMAYTSDRPGGRHIYVRPFPDVNSGGPWLITTEGTQPRWGHDGGELFYRGPEGIMAVEVETGGDVFDRRNPNLLFPDRYHLSNTMNWDVAPDGRFLMIRRGETDGATENHIILWQHFDEELTRLFPDQ